MVIENSFCYDRIIVIPARKYGNSVKRNKIRRQMKELFRLYPERVMFDEENPTTGHDIALVVYPGKVLPFSLLESNFYSLLDRIETISRVFLIPAFRIRIEA